MNDEKFVSAIFIELFEKNLSQYKESLTKPVDKNKDSFARARNAIALLDDSQKLDIINFLKVVIADSVSVVLGTLDGVHFPDNLVGDFAVSFDGEEIQGDLQDIFIQKAREAVAYD
ncbi:MULTISPECIES: hypothetical protein [Pseudomonas]|uniref:Uncharacterized protein n=1 Tax=Pseudomonas juntendi TaxID=2666183 RepID=A0AAJ5S439_9PSED|nr:MULTISPECIES: hypothetical protein [Pseudomonas]MDH1550772.1 hypothetical protein [Pseudomonas juntendi]QOH71475.1 hypothetical protein IGB31_03400 [Pseudomonas putida]WEA19767.1 hypothetical protein PWA60_21240 [Pseudomonas juntendi]